MHSPSALHEPLGQMPRPANASDLDKPPLTGDERHSIRRKKRPLPDSLGIISVFILVAGSIFLVVAVAFLAFLWRGVSVAPNQVDEGGLWQTIVVSGWATRTVTICSAVIRIAVSAQLGLVVPMVGSLLLEQHRVELPDVAFFTISRALNVNPVSLLFGKGFGLSRLPRSFAGIAITAAGIIAVSAFTSTILLSDFGDISTVGGTKATRGRIAGEEIGVSLDLWRSSFWQYPRFAEYVNDSEPLLVGPHIDDTGSTLRALLPFQTGAERSSLRNYTGPALVFDTRVTCFSPNITLLGFNTTADIVYTGYFPLVAVRGQVSFSDDHEGVLRAYNPSPGTQTFSFHCALPYDEYESVMSKNIFVCVFSAIMPNDDNYPAFTSAPPYAYLVLFVTQPDEGWKSAIGVSPIVGSHDYLDISSTDTTTSSQGPWTTTRFVADGQAKGLSISITACISSLSGLGYDHITATSSEDGAEPTLVPLRYDNLSFNDSVMASRVRPYDTEAVRRQLGATSTHLSLSERGVMALIGDDLHLDPIPSHQEVYAVDPWLFLPQFPLLETNAQGRSTITDKRANPAAIMKFGDTGRAQHQPPSIGHPSHVSLFSDSLNATGSLARALQAWLTTLTVQQYYDSLPRLADAGGATYVYSVPAAAPIHWAGFSAVVVMLGVHVVLVVWATVWFARKAEHSLLGNSWLAIAQVVSDATVPVLAQASMLNDLVVV